MLIYQNNQDSNDLLLLPLIPYGGSKAPIDSHGLFCFVASSGYHLIKYSFFPSLIVDADPTGNVVKVLGIPYSFKPNFPLIAGQDISSIPLETSKTCFLAVGHSTNGYTVVSIDYHNLNINFNNKHFVAFKDLDSFIYATKSSKEIPEQTQQPKQLINNRLDTVLEYLYDHINRDKILPNPTVNDLLTEYKTITGKEKPGFWRF